MNRLGILAAFLVGAAFGQPLTITLKPISLVTTRQALASGRQAGLWTVSVCSDFPARVSLDRGRITGAALDLTALPNDLAEDVIGRGVAANPRSFLGANGDTLLGFGASGLAVGGLATGTPGAAYAGIGMSVLQFLFRSIGAKAPNATPYFSRLLPDTVTIPSNGCTSDFYLFASLMKGAHPIQVKIAVPGASQ